VSKCHGRIFRGRKADFSFPDTVTLCPAINGADLFNKQADKTVLDSNKQNKKKLKNKQTAGQGATKSGTHRQTSSTFSR